jgi:glycosyltransferase 2 family protein
MKKTAINLLKFGASFAIIGYLVADARGDHAFADLANQPKHWGFISAAAFTCLGAVLLTFARWCLLVRALGLVFPLKDAVRLGFLGYLLNFVSLGSVGGDLFKAVFMARRFPASRPEAVATVVLDRLVGLYLLFVMASVAILATGQLHAADETLAVICRATLLGTAIGAAGILALLVPGITSGSFSVLLTKLPRVGPVCGKLLGAIRIYRSRPGALLLAAAVSVAVHTLTTLSIYFVARGLPGDCPSLAEHFVIVPLSMVTGVLPLPVNGLGAMEAVVKFFYDRLPAAVAIGEGHGFVVALGYRAVTILIAMIAAVYYLASRGEVGRVLRQAERELDEIRHQQAASGSASAAFPRGETAYGATPSGTVAGA